MDKTLRFLKRLGKPLLALVLVVYALIGVVTPAFAANQGDTDAPNLYDFYSLTSIASSVLSNAAGDPDAVIWGDDGVFGENICANGAGALLGFCDDKKVRGINILSILNSTSSAEYSYKTLLPGVSRMYDDGPGFGGYNSVFALNLGGESGSVPVFAPYVILGAVLSDTGLDEVKTWEAGMDGPFRLLSGGLIMVIYMISSVVPAVFSTILKVLKTLNPFQFFSGFRGAGFAALGMGHTDGVFGGAVGNVTSFVSTWFGFLYDMSAVILVFMLVFLIVRILFSPRARRASSTYKNFLVRGLFIFVGIPVLGMSYTQVLDMMSDSVGTGNTSAAYIIASTFCDMESFVNPGSNDNGLAGFNGNLYFTFDGNTGEIKADPSMDVQSLCRAINASGTPILPQSWRTGVSNGYSSNSILDMVEAAQTSQAGGGTSGLGQIGEGVDAGNGHDWIMSVIQRYMIGETISASTYAGTWIGDRWLYYANDTAQGKEHMKGLRDFIASHTNSAKYGDNGKLFTAPEGFDAVGYEDMNPFGVRNTASWPALGSNGRYSIDYVSWEPSALSVYNYLNTRFGSSKLTVYSSERSSSDASRGFHYSVNLAGSGFSSLSMFVMAILTLSVDAILGIMYAFGILMKNLSRGLHLITSVPLAMMGSLQAIARIITYTVVMVAEVLGTIIVYNLLSKLVFSIIYELLDEAGMAIVVVIGTDVARVSPLLLQVIGIIFLIWFIRMALKLRSTIVHSLDQAAEAVISKFVMGSGQATGALRGSEMVPVGSQMGSMPERSMGQKAMDTAGRAARTGTGVARTAMHGAATVAMLSSGNPAGMAEAAKAAESAKETEETATGKDGKPGASPTARSGGSDQDRRGIERTTSLSTAQNGSDDDFQLTDGTKDADKLTAEVTGGTGPASGRVPAPDTNRVRNGSKTDSPQKNSAEGETKNGTAMGASSSMAEGPYQPPKPKAPESQPQSEVPPDSSVGMVSNMTSTGRMRVRPKSGVELDAPDIEVSTSGAVSSVGGSNIVGPTGGVAGTSRRETATDYVHLNRQTEYSVSRSGGAAPVDSSGSGFVPQDTYEFHRTTRHTEIQMDNDSWVVPIGGGSPEPPIEEPPAQQVKPRRRSPRK